MGFFDYVSPYGKKNPLYGLNKQMKKLWTGTPEKRENVSTLRPEQEQGFQSLQDAANGPGASGAFGTVADYYRNNLSDNPADMAAFAAPEMRRFNEDIIPGLSEQFAGMGSGGLSSSGFRNAAVNAGTDLSERLGSIRAGLRQQSAQGLMNVGQQSLGNYSQNMVTEQGTQGLLGMAGPALSAGATAIAGPAAGALTQGITSMFSNGFQGGTKQVGQKTSPYGVPGKLQLPNFMGR